MTKNKGGDLQRHWSGRVNEEAETLLAMQRNLENIPSRETGRCKGPGVRVWS